MGYRLLSAAVAQGDEVENTTTEGSLAQHTFAANSLQVGKVYMITGSCNVNDSNSTDTLTLALRFGANATTPGSNTAIVSTAAIDAADSDIAAFVCYMTVRAVSASAGIVVFHGSICQSDAEAVGTTPMFGFHQVVSSLDTTSALYFDYSADWSVAHADNEVAADSFIVAEIV